MSNIILPSVYHQYYGRRQGRAASIIQRELLVDLLPKVSLKATDNPPNLANFDAVVLEIGAGGGENIAHLAQNNPNKLYIAAEPFMNGVAKILEKIAQYNLRNILIFSDSVWEIMPIFPDEYFEKIIILYPDPWPKRKHSERRMLTLQKIPDLHRVLKPSGLIEFATDHPILLQSVMVNMRLSARYFQWQNCNPCEWLQKPAHQAKTRYEERAFIENRPPTYLFYQRVG